MARYDYRCPACGKIIEREFKMGEAPDRHESYCDEADKLVELGRMITAVNFKIEDK